jgi:hypothetical protein
MKFHKLFTIAAAVCLSVVFLAGPAHADLQSVVIDYCDEVSQNVTSTARELDEASDDLVECIGDFDDCMNGLLSKNPVKCIGDYTKCIKFGKRDQKQACTAFLLEWGNDTRRAERSARRDHVKNDFVDWIFGDTSEVDDPTSDECLNPAFLISDVCTDQQIGD